MKERAMTWLARGALIGCVLLANACSLSGPSRPAPVKQSYLLNAERTGPTNAGHIPLALRVNRFVVAQPFDSRPLVYRATDLRFETDFYNEFLALPATMVTERTMRWLADARLFSAIVPMNSNIDARLVLEGSVWTLHGDYRNPQAPRAIIGIRFLLARDDTEGPTLLDRSFTRSVPVADRSPDQLVAAFDVALSRILAELEVAMAAALKNDKGR
ncbi:MAG: hypothetical protein EXR39_11000 [Betaproteobacteria bacterium]|nr:hypothetical protein [Betaproteobacteria bacterium]